MVKHTPGPWGVHPNNPRIVGTYSANVARCNVLAEGEAEANARLIAAAPELLAVLKALVANFDASVVTTDPMLVEARAIIAKAEGGQ